MGHSSKGASMSDSLAKIDFKISHMEGHVKSLSRAIEVCERRVKLFSSPPAEKVMATMIEKYGSKEVVEKVERFPQRGKICPI